MKNILKPVLLFLAFLIGLKLLALVWSDHVVVSLREHKFLIPKEHALESGIIFPEWLRSISGKLDDDSNMTLVWFDGLDISSKISEYKVSKNNDFRDDINVLLAGITEYEKDAYEDPKEYLNLKDVWYGTGAYTNRVVVDADVPGWYKVYKTKDQIDTWQLLNQYPAPDRDLPNKVRDFWIARCSMFGPTENRVGTCITYEIQSNLFFQYSVSDYNISLSNTISEFISLEIAEWKQN